MYVQIYEDKTSETAGVGLTTIDGYWLRSKSRPRWRSRHPLLTDDHGRGQRCGQIAIDPDLPLHGMAPRKRFNGFYRARLRGVSEATHQCLVFAARYHATYQARP
jgi:hypothetical protein